MDAADNRAERFARSVDGTRIAWQRRGTGETVILFIPTWNLVDSSVVRHQVAFLESRATVLTYDPRGAGASDRPSTGYDFTMHAADALAVLDAAGADRASIVTASRGLGAAATLAATHPERVDRMVAIGVYLRFEPPADDRFWTTSSITDDVDLFTAHGWRTAWPAFARRFMENVFSEPDSEETIRELVAIALEASPEILIAQERELDWDAAIGRLGSVYVPTLLIHGDDDRAVPASLAQRIADAMPDARLHVLRGAGHRPDIRTPERVNPVIADFLLR